MFPLVIALVGLVPVLALAQSVTLPAPSRTVYRCEVAGKVTYTDEPCLAGKTVDVEPTRGLGPRAGPDVRRERLNEQIGEALRPLTGMSPEQRAQFHKRFKLQPRAKLECQSLDRSMPENERLEQSAQGAARAEVQQTLLQERRRFRELGC